MPHWLVILVKAETNLTNLAPLVFPLLHLFHNHHFHQHNTSIRSMPLSDVHWCWLVSQLIDGELPSPISAIPHFAQPQSLFINLPQSHWREKVNGCILFWENEWENMISTTLIKAKVIPVSTILCTKSSLSLHHLTSELDQEDAFRLLSLITTQRYAIDLIVHFVVTLPFFAAVAHSSNLMSLRLAKMQSTSACHFISSAFDCHQLHSITIHQPSAHHHVYWQ